MASLITSKMTSATPPGRIGSLEDFPGARIRRGGIQGMVS